MTNTIYFVTNFIKELVRMRLVEKQVLPLEQDLLASVLVKSEQFKEDWTIQTFLYMKQAGLDVALVEQPVKGAICVAHFDTTKNKIWGLDSFVVGIRADRSPMLMREIEIVQSPANLGGKDVFLIQFWPQSRLIARDATRGNRIEKISYFGGRGGFSPQFQEPSYLKALKDLGVELNICYNPAKWNDYRETDLVLAVRDLHPLLLQTKPASKLVNAWQAQCVALLGNEPAFRAIGRLDEDYFEVNHPQDVLDIVTRLKENPALYQCARQAGIKRYPEFCFEAVQQQWIDLLTGPVTEVYADWKKDIGSNGYSRRTQRLRQSIHQWLDHKFFYAQVRSSDIIKHRWEHFKQ